MTEESAIALTDFLESWPVDEKGIKPLFHSLHSVLASIDGMNLDFSARPGVSYSLRGLHPTRSNEPILVLIDVIDDEPEERWLSVCFPSELITDPDCVGDVVPDGLQGKDACCFDVDQSDDEIEGYLSDRIREAGASAIRA
ncbi:MAG: hypothetical protein EOM25_13775 [Deltaproteobacteria bacterium]|nr:hypothetical protein [Deltaproteobacteria bacterium]